MSTIWPEQHSAAVKRLVESGLSYSQIANELWIEFKVAYSRNAVLGRANRMGLSTDSRVRGNHISEAMKNNRVTRKRPPSFSPRLGSIAMDQGDAIDREANPAQLRCVEVDALNIGLLELTDVNCHWPTGEGPITFCGLHKFEGSYCEAHYRLSVGRGTASERAASHVLAREAA